MSYWLRQSDLDSHDLDVVGLTLAHRNGEYFVAKVAERNGVATVEGVRAGDRLIQIEAMKTENATSGEIFAAMHGRPGDVRKLVVERDGKVFSVETHVTRF
jgi:C-terminal processing protease CtpA/Prc